MSTSQDATPGMQSSSPYSVTLMVDGVMGTCSQVSWEAEGNSNSEQLSWETEGNSNNEQKK
jgi:hypothetical protein